MIDAAMRKNMRARIAQVHFNTVGIPDLITFPDGTSTPPLFVTYSSTLMPGGSSPADLTLTMLVVPMDGGGWVPVSYMPTESDYLVETTQLFPAERVWIKATPPGSSDWAFQKAYDLSSGVVMAVQGLGPGAEFGTDKYLNHTTAIWFGDVAAQLPPGVTVQSMKMHITRYNAPLWEEVDTARPYIYAHPYSPSNPPQPGRAPGYVNGLSEDAAPMRVGQEQMVDVWATQLLAGSVQGFALGTPSSPDDYAYFGDIYLSVTYTGAIGV